MTHNEKVLALLSDGEWHDHHSLYALNVIAHSRIAELRRRGHEIEHRRDGDLYLYRLALPAGSGFPVSSTPAESSSPPGPAESASGHGAEGDPRTGAAASPPHETAPALCLFDLTEAPAWH